MKKINTSRLNQLKVRLKLIKYAVYKHSFVSPFISLPAVQELIRNISYFKTHTNDIEINQVCDKLLSQLNIISKQLKKGTTSLESKHIDKVDSENSSQETFYEPPQLNINLNDAETSELSDIHSSGEQEMVDKDAAKLELVQSNKQKDYSIYNQAKAKYEFNKKSRFNFAKANVLRFPKHKTKRHTSQLNANKFRSYINYNKISFKRKSRKIIKPAKSVVENIQCTNNDNSHKIGEELSQPETNISKNDYENVTQNINSKKIHNQNDAILNDNFAITDKAKRSIFIKKTDDDEQSTKTQNNAHALSIQKISLKPSALNLLESTRKFSQLSTNECSQKLENIISTSSEQWLASNSEPNSFDLFTTSQNNESNLTQFNIESTKNRNSTDGLLIKNIKNGRTVSQLQQKLSTGKKSISDCVSLNATQSRLEDNYFLNTCNPFKFPSNINQSPTMKSVHKTNPFFSPSQLKPAKQSTFKENPFSEQLVNVTENVNSFSKSHVFASESQTMNQTNLKIPFSMQCVSETQNSNPFSQSQMLSQLKPLNKSSKMKIKPSSLQSAVNAQNSNSGNKFKNTDESSSGLFIDKTQDVFNNHVFSSQSQVFPIQPKVKSNKKSATVQSMKQTLDGKEKSSSPLIINETQNIFNNNPFLSQSQVFPLHSGVNYNKNSASVQYVKTQDGFNNNNLFLSQSQDLSSKVNSVVEQPKTRKKRVTKTNNNNLINKDIIQQSIDDVKKATFNAQCRKKLM
ncbi:putative uncharacterized protein DDB_G0267716 [Chrysoperla carnea]|uniref:putative uncharacterized protein DDB_G0267716 n=1 Tax=Chrysoperla carnea TaxID=189513 RepID=UPI001D087A97|nr:putative uncharacterized protein DDB_G0267716 [Chrysoperla carnea]